MEVVVLPGTTTHSAHAEATTGIITTTSVLPAYQDPKTNGVRRKRTLHADSIARNPNRRINHGMVT